LLPYKQTKRKRRQQQCCRHLLRCTIAKKRQRQRCCHCFIRYVATKQKEEGDDNNAIAFFTTLQQNEK